LINAETPGRDARPGRLYRISRSRSATIAPSHRGRVQDFKKELTHRIEVEKPVPVYVDTTANIRTFRDTIFLPYGTIKEEQIVLGELIKKDLLIDLKIPEIYRTLEVHNTVTHSIRNRMLFATIGLRIDFNHYATPVFGVAFIPNGHRYLFGVVVGVDGMVGVNLGLKIAR
jgi:hypothetical protein